MLSEPSFGVGGGGGGNEELEAPPAEAPLALAPVQPTDAAMEKMVGEPPKATPESSILEVTPLGLMPTSTAAIALDNADQVVSATEEVLPQLQIAEGTLPHRFANIERLPHGSGMDSLEGNTGFPGFPGGWNWFGGDLVVANQP